jgi:Uma2 family endonuclease
MATQTKLVTYDDYLTLPDDGKRYEVIEGELIMTTSPITKHERISRKLLIRLDNYIEKHNIGEVFDAPFDVVLSMTDVVQPDLMFISKERSHIITDKNIVEAPDLVIEIISEGTKVRDQTTKKWLYERYGVKEYWIVYPNEEKVEQFILQEEELALKQTFEQPGTLSCKTIKGFTLPLNKVFKS